MKVLLTGAGGFLGAHIARALAGHDHQVVALSRKLSDGPFRVDLTDKAAVAHALEGRRFDAVIHAAATMKGTLPLGTRTDYSDNVLMTSNLLDALEGNPPGRLVMVSSIDVFGPPDGVLCQDVQPSPADDYGLSKLKSEEQSALWAKSHGVPLTTLRITQIFGPGDQGRKFIPAMIGALASGDPMKLFGDGSDRRDLLYAPDAARIIVRLMEKDVNGTLLVATGESRRLADVLKTAEHLAGRPVPKTICPRTKPAIDYVIDVSQLKESLGDFTTTHFEEALTETLKVAGVKTLS